MFLGNAFSFHCDFKNAQQHYNNAISFLQDFNSDIGIAMFKGALSFMEHGFSGDIDKAYQIGLEAVKLADKSNSNFAKGVAYTSYGFALYYKDRIENAGEVF